MALRKRGRTISMDQVRSGQILEIQYTDETGSTDTSMILVIDPNASSNSTRPNKLHAIKLTNLTEADMEILISDIRSIIGRRRNIDEIDKITMYEAFKDTPYGVTRPYRTYTRKNIRDIKRITLGQSVDPPTKKLKLGNGSVLYGVSHDNFVHIAFDEHEVLYEELVSVGGKTYFEGQNGHEAPTKSLLDLLMGRNNYTSATWDTKSPLNRGPEYQLVLELFGGEFSAIRQQIGDTSDDTLLNTLLKNTSAWSDGGYTITEDLILYLCSLGNIDTDVLYEPYDIKSFKKFHDTGQKIAFDLNDGNPLEKVQIVANNIRDVNLIEKMESNIGVYFAGHSHIDLVKKLLSI
jgi:hypothetical protein